MTSPRPHPDVVNCQPSVLIVGYGHVGHQMARYFTDADYVDEDGRRMRVENGCTSQRRVELRWDGREHVAIGQEYDLGFLCVPTPEADGGHCDVSIVRQAFRTWGGAARYWCLKSTVEVGTTHNLGQNVCFSPEYYGETLGHPLRDEVPFIILGGESEVTEAFAAAWSLVTTSQTRIYQTDAKTAELCKLMENAWLATKVTFCNEFYSLAQAAGVDWHTLRELWLADPRVSRSHTYVYPANRGFGGKCLPKDTANLCAWARAQGEPARLIEAVRQVNARLRGHAEVPA